jgi:tetratricopeptide (TPR) repeat protein
MTHLPPRICVLLAFLAGACAASSTNVQNDSLRTGAEAFYRGDVLEAYRLLRNPALTQEPPPPHYSALLKQVTAAAEYLIERWLEKGNFWLAQGNFSKAILYYRDITDQLPEDDPFRIKLTKKARELQSKIEGIRKEIETLVEGGLGDFKASEFRRAKHKLVEARWKALDHNLPFAMKYQRLIEECQRRLPEELEDIVEIKAKDVPADTPAAKAGKRLTQKSRRRRALRKKKSPVKIDDEEVYRGLLRLGNRYRARKIHLEAILTYRKVLELYPEQPEAARELEKLEPVRKQLLGDELKKAGRHFAKENLQKAAPHYQRALLLDPGNIRAKEGLQMYRRLKELKNQQK